MSSSDLPIDILNDINNFENVLDKLESQLEPFFRVPLKEHQESLTPIENAKLNITVAYALNSLFFMYLQTQGVSPHDHQVKTELDRIKPYILKLKTLSNENNNNNNSENTEEKKVQIDTEVAKRMINNTLASNKKLDESAQKKRKK